VCLRALAWFYANPWKDDWIQMKTKDAVDLVWRILSGMPVEVFDDDDGSVWDNGKSILQEDIIRKEINRIVDLMIQADSIRESIVQN
jgi:hypothetical protein